MGEVGEEDYCLVNTTLDNTTFKSSNEFTIPYGIVVLGRDVAGYVKRGSKASLAAGAGALSVWAFARGHFGTLFATVLQTGPRGAEF
ncbi:hypothetical protein E2562_003948 [Oryza meyeriana var. granulata]|uniref:Uncharacterized protein n=1 Tax=Oryza meyeriana var. granulata TaxID=110450 RepID=A0A6G1D0U2_9ORYZ|nr:hypothetical protein E2562_003948 [Oryza meyeriana var. granulata]